MTKKEMLELLNGMEVISIQFEGCVKISKGKIIQRGEVIVANPTKKQLSELINEAFYDEFGTFDVDYIL